MGAATPVARTAPPRGCTTPSSARSPAPAISPPPCSPPPLRPIWPASAPPNAPPPRRTHSGPAAYARLPPDAPWSATLQQHLLSVLRDQFCIGYELPPYLTGLLDQHAIPYIDIRLHPIRFMDDLLFAVRASHPATRANLSALAIPEAEVIITAGLREAMCQFISQAAIPANTLLVLGQRPYNSTQIVAGDFFDAATRRPQIAAIRARHAAIVLKPHPHEPQHSLLTIAAGLGGAVLGPVNDNLYRLLSMPEITAILTVSSSVAYEAPYFGKTVHTLRRSSHPPRLAWRRHRPGHPCLAGRHCSLHRFLARRSRAPHRDHRAGRRSPPAQTQSPAHRPRQLLELQRNRHGPPSRPRGLTARKPVR